MAFNDTMQLAKKGGVASSAEYNKVVNNVREVHQKNLDQDGWMTQHLDGVSNANASHATINSRLDALESKDSAQDTELADIDARIGPEITAETSVYEYLQADNDRISVLETNQGTRGTNGTIYAEIEALKADSGGGGGTPVLPYPDDTLLYGDVISNVPRKDAWYGESLGNGYMSVSATIATKSIDSPTTGKFGVLSPAAGSGTFRWAMYTGSSLSSLSKVDEGGWTAALTTAGVQDGLSLNGFSITAGQYVALLWLCSGYTTEANLASTPFGSGTQNLIADGTSVYSVWDQNNPSSLPDTLDLTDSGTDGTWAQASNQFWFAVA